MRTRSASVPRPVWLPVKAGVWEQGYGRQGLAGALDGVGTGVVALSLSLSLSLLSLSLFAHCIYTLTVRDGVGTGVVARRRPEGSKMS